MDGEFFRMWSGTVSTLISIATVIWVGLTSGAKKTASDLEEFQKQDTDEKKKLIEAITALNTRLQVVESEMRHLPNRETTHTLEIGLARITVRLDALDERLDPIVATSVRLQELMMKQATK